MNQTVAIIDIGKTRSKLSLWTADGKRLRETDYVNRVVAGSPRQLDVAGIGGWLKNALAMFAREAEIGAIVPVAHGAAAVLMSGDRPLAALDYEQPLPPDVAAAYDALRDPFEATLSPRLANGLNLGAQLYWLERLHPEVWPATAQLLLWPQYWAWVLSGERASEVTSLGCHSDLWRPAERRFSDLASSRGWAERLGPRRHAADILGPVHTALADELGLPRDCAVHCGLHDSNAALLGARGFAQLAGGSFAVVSTGTWFVCMAVGGGAARYDPAEDMLANVDVDGEPTPTGRFMGGRDYEAWMGDALGARTDTAALGESTAQDSGPLAPASTRAERAALDLARSTDRILTMLAARGAILIEGRFAADAAFAEALARLRPTQPIYRSALVDGVAFGAFRLVRQGLAPPGLLQRAG